MGRDKGSLVYPAFGVQDQRSRIHDLLLSCGQAYGIGEVFVSCRTEQNQLIPKRLSRIYDDEMGVKKLIGLNQPHPHKIGGPALGLLSAHLVDSKCAWLVIACDMPFLDEQAILDLLASRDPSNAATVLEPLAAIWEPRALLELARDAALGFFSPCGTLERLPCKVLVPHSARVLQNINAPEEYQRAIQINACSSAPAESTHRIVL